MSSPGEKKAGTPARPPPPYYPELLKLLAVAAEKTEDGGRALYQVAQNLVSKFSPQPETPPSQVTPETATPQTNTPSESEFLEEGGAPEATDQTQVLPKNVFKPPLDSPTRQTQSSIGLRVKHNKRSLPKPKLSGSQTPIVLPDSEDEEILHTPSLFQEIQRDGSLETASQNNTPAPSTPKEQNLQRQQITPPRKRKDKPQPSPPKSAPPSAQTSSAAPQQQQMEESVIILIVGRGQKNLRNFFVKLDGGSIKLSLDRRGTTSFPTTRWSGVQAMIF